MRKLLVYLSLIALTGCAHTSSEMKAGANFEGTIEIEKNYQEVYRALLSMSRQCLEDRILQSEVTVSGDIYHDIKEANISQRLTGGGVLVSTGSIDIKAISDTKTVISVYAEKSGYWSFGVTTPTLRNVQRWANGDKVCAIR